MKIIKAAVLVQTTISPAHPHTSKTVYSPAVELEDGSLIPYAEEGRVITSGFEEDAKSLADAYFKKLPKSVLM
ncbi:MAG: hypothetical protein A2527_01025 [Candidatus Lambdaproteobacteria bacterium RIFOXYD2_FULL_50_16]|uniref:Uncharacterized protein n=1 Tax=Candidatus Lambdaproteobacteria bacterium RIFOXYD2_FULL_50_16 TaxID=1817772 RepID=A0A1F6G9L3_9PROT|nr:MAG: hypothetical protein A2527_01025 [Candidatus Lambdaproteobacteria bacterium RIFOXYD2_FULL_50_16]